MQYTLVHNDQIKVGPRQYNVAFFNQYLTENGITATIPATYDGLDAIVISPTVKIVATPEVSFPAYDALTEQLSGPFYDLTKDPIVGSYQVVDRDMSAVKNDLKQTLAANRYSQEVGGTKVTLQGQSVSVDTDRDGRNIWFQSYMLLPDGSTQRFKFPKESIWLDLTKADIGLVVQAIMGHVQGAFQWEQTKVSEVDAATTKAQLVAVDTKFPVGA